MARAAEAERRLEDITRLVSDWIWECDAEFRLTFVSQRVSEVLGVHPMEMIGQRLSDRGQFLSPEGNPISLDWHQPFRDCHYETVDRSGAKRLFLINGLPFYDPTSGRFKGVRGTAEDITQRRQTEEMLVRLSRAVEQSPALVVITDTDGVIQYVNPKFVEVTGYTAREAIGSRPSILKSGLTPTETYQDLWATITAGNEWHGEVYNRKKDGDYFWVSVSISPIRAPDDTVTHFVGVSEDITARKFYEERILRQEYYDALTELPNRTLFFDRLGRALTRARRDDHELALMIINLDRFKFVNDTLGHEAGDQLLREAARRLSAIIGSTDSIARLGGDEFTITLSNPGGRYQTTEVVSEILSAFGRPFRVADTDVHVYGSVGIALFPEDGEDQYSLLKNADTAMQQAKERGGNTYQFITQDMNARAAEYLTLGNDLRFALERDQLEVFYQPVVDIRSGSVVGAEALLRWRHPAAGLIGPKKFVPLAEESGLIEPIGEWLLHVACQQNREWRDHNLPPIRVAVNVSSRQFRRGRLEKAVVQALEDAALAPTHLGIEITESAFIEDLDETNAILMELSQLGVVISVDDFGTGYSSLGYLKRLHPSTLKIDRSFIHDVTTNPDAVAITEAIIGMAHSLQMTVIAEGVETSDQLEFLRGKGCQMMQGFLFSPPLLARDFTELLREGRRLDTGPDLFSFDRN